MVPIEIPVLVVQMDVGMIVARGTRMSDQGKEQHLSGGTMDMILAVVKTVEARENEEAESKRDRA